MKGNMIGQWKIKYEDTDRTWAVINYYPDNKDTANELLSFYRSGKLKRKQWEVKGKDTGQCFTEEGKELAFTPFEKKPSFKGDLSRFIGMNIHYPDEAREKWIQGKVNVELFINEDGSIETKTATGPHTSLCQEAVRVVQLMPKWQPGMLDDKPVKVYFTLPVSFRLE